MLHGNGDPTIASQKLTLEQFLRSDVAGQDHVFISSTSRQGGLNNSSGAAGDTICVEIYNPAKFAARLKTEIAPLSADCTDLAHLRWCALLGNSRPARHHLRATRPHCHA